MSDNEMKNIELHFLYWLIKKEQRDGKLPIDDEKTKKIIMEKYPNESLFVVFRTDELYFPK